MTKLAKKLLLVLAISVAATNVNATGLCDRDAKIDTSKIVNLLGNKKFLLIGEGHGRKEMSPIIEELLCLLTERGGVSPVIPTYPSPSS